MAHGHSDHSSRRHQRVRSHPPSMKLCSFITGCLRMAALQWLHLCDWRRPEHHLSGIQHEPHQPHCQQAPCPDERCCPMPSDSGTWQDSSSPYISQQRRHNWHNLLSAGTSCTWTARWQARCPCQVAMPAQTSTVGSRWTWGRQTSSCVPGLMRTAPVSSRAASRTWASGMWRWMLTRCSSDRTCLWSVL